MKKFLIFSLCLLIAYSVLANPISFDPVSYPKEPFLVRKIFRLFHLAKEYYPYMLLAGVTEALILWCFKYRGWKNLSYIFIVNLISNFLLNVYAPSTFDILESLFGANTLFIQILVVELGIVLFEFLLLGKALKYNGKLFGVLAFANVVSFGIGFAIL